MLLEDDRMICLRNQVTMDLTGPQYRECKMLGVGVT